MELNDIASAVSSANATQVSALASLLLLRKTLQLQAESAIGLLQTIPPATPSSNPPNLGNSIDVMA